MECTHWLFHPITQRRNSQYCLIQDLTLNIYRVTFCCQECLKEYEKCRGKYLLTLYAYSKAIGYQWVSLCVTSSETVEPNELTFSGMISLGVQMTKTKMQQMSDSLMWLRSISLLWKVWPQTPHLHAQLSTWFCKDPLLRNIWWQMSQLLLGSQSQSSL